MSIHNANELSLLIKNIADNIENLKVIYSNKDTISVTAIQFEKEIIENKSLIIDFLSNPQNYDNWKQSSNNNSLLLMKYIDRKHFIKELKNETDLISKLNLDFKSLYESTDKDLLLSNIEKQHINKDLSNEEELVKSLHDSKKMFTKSYSFMLKEIPVFSKLSEMLNKCVSLIKNNPILLKDHPEHFVINRNQGKFITYSCEDFGIIISNASIGDKDSINKAEKLLYCLSSLERKESHVDTIKTNRDKYLTNDDKQVITNKYKNKNSF